MISDIRAIVLLASSVACSSGSSAATFTPELGMLMAESLVRGNSRGIETLSYAGLRSAAGGLFLVNASADRLTAEPIDFANRLDAMRGLFEHFGPKDFGETMNKFNTTCIDATNVTAHYTVHQYATIGMAQAGILSAIMGMRAKVCGYSSAQLISFTTSQVRNGIAEMERHILHSGIIDVTRCWLQRLHYAVRRLSEDADPLVSGFLTMDNCLPGRTTRHIIPRDVPLGLSDPHSYYDASMVDVPYPERDIYQTGNFSRGAWLLETPDDAAYASVWFNLMRGVLNYKSQWELFSIQDRFTLTLQRNLGRDKLILSSACSGEEVSHVNLTYRAGWRFVSVGIQGNLAVIRYEDRSWQVEAPPKGDCGVKSASLGPRLDIPWDQKQAENATIRFYDFKVSAQPGHEEDVPVTRKNLTDLGNDIPVVCNAKYGNERRDGLRACYPGPVVRVQYVYDVQPEPVRATVDVVTADVPVTVEGERASESDDFAFGQREFLIMTGVSMFSSFLIMAVFLWYLHRSFKRQLQVINEQIDELSRNANYAVSSGSPAQARASGGLLV